MSLHARIDINLPKDKKIRRAGYLCELLYIRGILFSKEMLSDGAIDFSQLDIISAGIPGNSKKIAEKLVENKLWEVTEDGWRVPMETWSRWQLTASEVKEKQAATAERVRKYRESRNAAKRDCNADVTRYNCVTSNGCNTTPESEPEPESESDLIHNANAHLPDGNARAVTDEEPPFHSRIEPEPWPEIPLKAETAPAKPKRKAKPKADLGELHGRFERFWEHYPRKTAKQDAITAFVRIAPTDEDVDRWIHIVQQQTQANDWKRDGCKFCPFPATWLNGKRWTDTVEDTSGLYRNETEWGTIKPAAAESTEPPTPEQLARIEELKGRMQRGEMSWQT
jgi:hypothetical protein